MKSLILKTLAAIALTTASFLVQADWQYHLEADKMTGSMDYETVQISSVDKKHSLLFVRKANNEELFFFFAYGKVIDCNPFLDCEIRLVTDTIKDVLTVDGTVAANFQSLSIDKWRVNFIKWRVASAKQIRIEYKPYKEESKIVIFETTVPVSKYWSSFDKRLGAK